MNFKDFIAEHGQPLAVKRQEHVFHQGFADGRLYYVVSGLLKAYYVSIEGKQSIKSFIQAGNVIGSLSSAYSKLPCSFSLVALEDCQLMRIPFKELLDASNESHEIAREVIETLIGLSMKKEQREYEFLTLSAEDRYINLRERDPQLIERLTQNDIAHYLGITPVALSRIRKRMTERAQASG